MIDDELDDVFNDDDSEVTSEADFEVDTDTPLETEETGEEQETEEQETEEESKDETEEEVEEVEEEAETPAAEDSKEDDKIPVAALKSERTKRQAAEQRVRELEEKYEGVEYTDEQRSNMNRTAASRETMLEIVDDFEEKEEVFMKMAQDNPSLVTKMHAAKSPAKFAYDAAKEHMKLEEAKSLYNSEDFEEYKAWKKAKEEQANEPKVDAAKESRKKSALKTPKINKLGSSQQIKDNDEDDLWKDSQF